MSTLEHDVAFLASHNIMDYSLLVGIKIAAQRYAAVTAYQHQQKQRRGVRKRGVFWPIDVLAEACLIPLQLAIDTLQKCGVVLNEQPAYEYQMGLIDVLQRYNIRKSLETAAKGVIHDKHQISAVPAQEYAARLLHFIDSNFE
jgi:Phosphatidylinositol-4-phosphate 5-Kinase